jgi:hypothetical protein
MILQICGGADRVEGRNLVGNHHLVTSSEAQWFPLVMAKDKNQQRPIDFFRIMRFGA